MLKLDCLLVNTEVKETVKKLVGYLGNKGIANGEDVSFGAMFDKLRKNGVEIDKESLAHIYAGELPLHDARFTSEQDLYHESGRWRDDLVRAMMLQKPRKGEKEIGDLSPSDAVAKGIANAFLNNVTVDATTKSMMKRMEDIYRAASQRLLGELPNAAGKDTRTTAEIVKQAIDNESLGYRNTADGSINGLAKMHDAVRSELGKITAEFEANGDHDKAEEWKNYAKSLEDASYSLMFTSAEAQNILHTSLRDAGFTKRTKSGSEVKDWEKLAGTQNSYADLRKNVVESLKKQGFSEDVGNRVADSMSKEFRDIRGKMLETAEREQQRLKDSWNKKNNPRNPHNNIIDERLRRWENYKLLSEDPNKPLTFARSEANRIVSQVIKDLGYVKQINGRDAIDYEKLANNGRSKYDIERLVTKGLEAQGYDHATAQEVSGSVKEMSKEVFDKVKDYVTAREAKAEDTWLQKNGQPTQQMSLKDLVDLRMRQTAQHQQIAGSTPKHMSLRKYEAQRILNETLRNSEFGQDTANGRRIDWTKMAQNPLSEAELIKMVSDHLQKEGVSPYDADFAANSIKEVYSDLAQDIKDHAQSILDAREFAMDRESPQRRTDLHRLAELHDLGIFDGAHDRLLAHTLGIEQSDIAAIQGIKEFAGKLSKFRQLMSGHDFIAPSMLHNLNREIHNILAPVFENKTALMKRVSVLNKIYQLENSMLISTHGNIMENHLSGLMELLTTNLSQRLKLGNELGGVKAQDLQVMKDMYAHVAAGGAEFGLAPYQVGGTKERLTDKYNIHKMKGADWSKPSTWAKGVATAVLTIPRTFLSGADSAVKIGLMNAHMKSGVIDAMMANDHTMTKDAAVQMYNDAIYGPGQLDAARQKAEQIYKSLGMTYTSQKELNVLANEMLRENLIQNRLVTADELKTVMENAWHQAGLGMGHEANNVLSKMQQSFKQRLNREEQQAMADGDWNKASKKALTNTIMNNVVLRFVASRYNWAWIRAEQAGAGLVTGLYHYAATGRKFKNVDVFDAEKMNEQAVEYQKARQKLARGAVGLGINMVGYMATRAIAAALYPSEEDPMEQMFDDLKGNYPAAALFLKVAPFWMLASYEYNVKKNGSDAAKSVHALGGTFENLTNIGDQHDPAVLFGKSMAELGTAKTDKMEQRGFTDLGKIFNNYIPHVPLLKQGKNVLQFANWIGGGPEKPMPPFPDNFWQGLLYGGVIQDALGLFPAESLPEPFQDWGAQPETKK